MYFAMRVRHDDVTFASLNRFFFLNESATTDIYTGGDTLSLHDALPISLSGAALFVRPLWGRSVCPPSLGYSVCSPSLGPLCLSTLSGGVYSDVTLKSVAYASLAGAWSR